MRDRFPLVMIGGLLLLAVLGSFVLKGAARGAFADRLSTWRSEPDGARALYLLAEDWQLPVSRGQQSFETIDEQQNLVLLGVDLSEPRDKLEKKTGAPEPFFGVDADVDGAR
ncbi:MAG: hypothetical protein IPJ65_15765 [Archangiaceae bacterium]|nr:hypothetical protein [Archangiaceae bacterium]